MKRTILIGPPNVGKSALFSRLTHRFTVVSNYPGTTVEVMTGICQRGGRQLEVVDTPGVYSLYPLTEEESVTQQILSKPASYVLHVVDGTNMERMLPFTLELMEMGFPVILVINMLDEVKQEGMTIDLLGLEEELGIPVVGTNALSGEGVSRLKRLVFHYTPTNQTLSWPIIPPTPIQQKQEQYRKKGQEIAARYMNCLSVPPPWTVLDKILLHPIFGLLIALIFLYTIMYQIMGRFAAGYLVDLIDSHIFQSLIDPWFTRLIQPYAHTILPSLLTGDYGLVTLGFRYTFIIILPVVGIFYFTFALLEDSGYLPRLAVVMDSWCQYVGLSGAAVLPLVLGLGCGTMAVLSTRILETSRERKIATFLLALAVPCSSQMALFVTLLSAYPQALLGWLFTLILVFLGTGSLLAIRLPGSESMFCQEIPRLRVPSVRRCLEKTIHRLTWYMYEVIPLFIAAQLVIWLGFLLGVVPFLIQGLEKLAVWLNLPKESAPIFLFGFFRRDYGAAGLYDLAQLLTWQQLTVICVVLTLFTPCSAQLITMIKERGLWWTIKAVLVIVGISITTGTILARWVF